MKLLAVAFLMLINSAFAAELKIFDIPVITRSTRAGAGFKINEKLGRAWVELTVAEPFTETQYSQGDTYEIKVEGLTYDAQTKTVNLDIDGQRLECAVVQIRGRSIFRRKVIQKTGCDFRTQYVVVEVDNGIRIRKVLRLNTFLVTK
jgi:hypothetical protein